MRLLGKKECGGWISPGVGHPLSSKAESQEKTLSGDLLEEKRSMTREKSRCSASPIWKARFLGVLVLFVLAACQTFPRFTVEPLPHYEALFERPSGWSGGDGAYSTALGSNRFLWLFGDTLMGEVKDGRRVIAGMVPNSIAIQTGNEPQALSINFFPDGGSMPFLKPREGPGWFWPYHALRTPDGLYLFLLQVERAEAPPPFGFMLVANWLGHIANPEDPPDRWIFSQHKIPWGNAQRQFGSFVLMEGGYAYIYGTVAEPAKQGITWNMILARAPMGRLADFQSWHFFRDGEWIANGDRAGRICANVASEFSVSFHPPVNRYVLVYTEKGFSQGPDKTVLRLAPSLYGPWSDPIQIYRCPEAERDPRLCCYAAKGHPEIALSSRELLLTYVANSCTGDLKVLSDANLYRPRFLRIHFADPRRKNEEDQDRR